MALEKDQRGLDATIGQKQPVGELRQLVAILRHAILFCCGAAPYERRVCRQADSWPHREDHDFLK
jgi:hypothetical protein